MAYTRSQNAVAKPVTPPGLDQKLRPIAEGFARDLNVLLVRFGKPPSRLSPNMFERVREVALAALVEAAIAAELNAAAGGRPLLHPSTKPPAPLATTKESPGYDDEPATKPGRFPLTRH